MKQAPNTPKPGKRTPKRLPVTLSPEETAALLARINTACTTGLRNRTMLQVMLGAGLRVSEVVSLRGVDVDLSRGEVRVLGKGGKERVVPVDRETLQWLQAWAGKRRDLGLTPRDPFFGGLRVGRTGRGYRARGEALKPRYVQALVARLAQAAGIAKRVTPHTFRHTYATRLLDGGRFNIREVQTLLGHASVQTTQVYTHVNPEELRAKMQAKVQEAPPVDPQVQALALALANLTPQQRAALAGLLQATAGGVEGGDGYNVDKRCAAR